ncbi:hypothetical protein, variant [Aphanomyces invadans]|uniref:Peptidase A1 domain-containing protein n=1 Tax=Aphanomyces invadans TaxID=157072 RepID=A0A024UHE6_9STRA|nr:hypothetical protein, variant [Aphanomyces invadans]ETW05292.1 hypothetical protein, variant [Aphanomyces invadans]|eukprot:XP_008866729.1 hypothetical protein, variant [Aphanomyces invadans]
MRMPSAATALAALVMLSAVVECIACADKVVRLDLRPVPGVRSLQASSPFNEQRVDGTFSSHSAELYLGVPPQKATVVIDTGSAVTAVVCATCTDCGVHNRPPYDPTKSTTAKPLACSDSRCLSCSSQQCTRGQTYADSSSFEAFLVSELAMLGNFNGSHSSSYVQANGVSFVVGCQTSVTGGFKTHPEAGIMGMQQDSSTILAAMVREGRVSRNAFSLCLAPLGAGTIVLGGVSDHLNVGAMKHTPLVRPAANKYYSVDVIDLLVGNESLGLDRTAFIGFGGQTGRSFVFDSGSTISQLPPGVHDKLLQVLQAATGNPSFGVGGTAVVPADVMAKLPTLRFVLEAVAEEGGSIQTVGFRKGGGGIGGVLGANVMLNHNVVFDLDKQRVGIAPATCSNTRETVTDIVRQPSTPATTHTTVAPLSVATSSSSVASPAHVVLGVAVALLSST